MNVRSFQNYISYLILISLLILFMSCSNSIKLVETRKSTNCKTTIEGVYISPSQWREAKPALIVEEDGERQFLRGEIISYDSSGVTFDPKRESPLYDPKPKYYSFDKVATFIDEEGRVIAGTLPQKLTTTYSMELFPFDSTKANKKPYKMVLKPNQEFGYCIPEGNYLVVQILFVDKKGNVDVGIGFPKLSVLVEANHANRIGTLFLNLADSTVTDSLIVPYKILSRPNEAAMMGFLGGAVGGALHAASISKKIRGKHRIYFATDDVMDQQGRLPKRNNCLTVYKDETH
jgi:hypothetical protein